MAVFTAMLAAAIGIGVVMPFAGIHLAALVMSPISRVAEKLARIGAGDDLHRLREVLARTLLALACGSSVLATILFASHMWPHTLAPAWPVAIVPGAAAFIAGGLTPLGPSTALTMIVAGLAGISAAAVAALIWS